MKQLTESKTIKFSKVQMNSLNVLESYNINVSQFIRLAIKEKIQKDWNTIKQIKEQQIKNDCYF